MAVIVIAVALRGARLHALAKVGCVRRDSGARAVQRKLEGWQHRAGGGLSAVWTVAADDEELPTKSEVVAETRPLQRVNTSACLAYAYRYLR